METYNSHKFNQDIKAVSDGKVANKRSTKSTVTGLILLLLGGVAFIVAGRLAAEAVTPLTHTLYTGGILAMITGAIMLIWLSRRLQYIPTGSTIKRRSTYFDTHEVPYLTSLIETADYAELNKLHKDDNAGGIRMDLDISKDGRFVAVQLFNYIPHNYEVASSIYCLYDSKAQDFLKSFPDFKS